FLKVQEGPAGARESYQYVVDQSKSDLPKYVSSLLFDRSQKIEKLKEYFQAHPDFAPAAYHLAQEYSEAALGTQSLEDKRQEKKYLEEFKKLDQEGKLVKYFIDQELIAEFRDHADQRLKKLETSVASNVLENPVRIVWMSGNSGWTGTLTIPEPTQEIFWKKSEESEFRSTGLLPIVNSVTGKNMPNPTIEFPLGAKAADLEVRYVNLHGETVGPFKVAFQPTQAGSTEHKQILTLTKSNWASFREYDGDLLLYFTHVLTYRGSISKIRYGLNVDKPDQEFAFPAFDKSGIAEIPSGSGSYIKVPK
ncbi:MAG TPA: hypothetical protein DF383_12345, partial [Deltaproteobacteria bacterium]|nr:hypothetical protein [Deltaproteobacteria bacterium]